MVGTALLGVKSVLEQEEPNVLYVLSLAHRAVLPYERPVLLGTRCVQGSGRRALHTSLLTRQTRRRSAESTPIRARTGWLPAIDYAYNRLCNETPLMLFLHLNL